MIPTKSVQISAVAHAMLLEIVTKKHRKPNEHLNMLINKSYEEMNLRNS